LPGLQVTYNSYGCCSPPVNASFPPSTALSYPNCLLYHVRFEHMPPTTPPLFITAVVTTMSPSRFVEVMDPNSHTATSPLDVRLEDIIAQSDLSQRTRSASGASLGSSSSEQLSKDDQSPQRKKSGSSKRRSRIFSFTNR
jgi:hypothetical protein